ncbi:MAG: hypothetical protein NTX57_00340, partial [Armatimonadetes bacterium]|nr:hypothetical protein [Armatimonadota bacterium]
MQLSLEQRMPLDNDGFVVLERVFTPDVLTAVTERIESYQKRHEEAIAVSGGTQGISRASEITFTSHLAENDP